jgi:hypothetical protein
MSSGYHDSGEPGAIQLTGTLSDGVESVPVSGAGTMTGTVAAGDNPSVNLVVRTPACPVKHSSRVLSILRISG